MSPLDESHRPLAEAVWRELATVNELTPGQAKLYSRGVLTSWNVEVVRWSAQETQEQLGDAHRLIQAADMFLTLLPPEPSKAEQCYRRAGEILEWLARSRDDARGTTPLALFAAGAFQLGGLPAMATGLLRQPDTLNGEARLYAAYLSGDFDGVLEAGSSFWSENDELTGRDGSSLLVSRGADAALHFAIAEVVRCLGLAADCLRRGDGERLETVRRKLAALERFFLRYAPEDGWILIRLLRATTDRFASASIFPRVRALAGSNPAQRQRLDGFARQQFAKGRGILWSSQIAGLSRLTGASSFALCTPTGSGKTLIAILALARELAAAEAGQQAPLALYIVPSRALGTEVEAKLATELGSAVDCTVTGLYGGTDWGITDHWLTSNQPTVLIATVEKVDALLRHLGPVLLTRLRLVIVDEAHNVVTATDTYAQEKLVDHNSRPMRLESLLSRLFALKPDLLRIALTAVAGGAALPVAKWVEGSSTAEPIGTEYRSTRQVIGVLETDLSTSPRLFVEVVNGKRQYVRGGDSAVYIPLRVPTMPRPLAAIRSSLYHVLDLQVFWTALHLRSSGRRMLISVTQKIETVMKRYSEALRKEEWSKAASFTAPTDERDRIRFEQTLSACADYCGENSFELSLLRHGIATNHGQMPQRLRRLMTDLIDCRICSIVVATATLTEGVNLPFDIVFVTSLKRSGGYDEARRQQIVTPMTLAEFRNLVGRAGRPGAAQGMEGMTLIALPRGVTTTAASQISTQLTQVNALAGDYEAMISSLVASEGPHGAVTSPLALLLGLIRSYAHNYLGLDDAGFLAWLETTAAQDVSPFIGQSAKDPLAKLADGLDELDALLLAATEDLSRIEGELEPARLEAFQTELWRRSFSAVASQQPKVFSQAVVTRGVALPTTIYPDPARRRRLYQFGFSPAVGLRFELVAELLKAELAGATSYAAELKAAQLERFRRMASLIAQDPAYGFRAKATAAA